MFGYWGQDYGNKSFIYSNICIFIFSSFILDRIALSLDVREKYIKISKNLEEMELNYTR